MIRSPRDRIGLANATFINGFDLGIGIGSVAGGILASIYGYSIMYMIFAGLIVISAVIIILHRNIMYTNNKQ